MIKYKQIIGGLLLWQDKKEIHKVEMTDGKRAIIQQLFQEYNIESATDIQDALKDLLGDTIKQMMETEMDEHNLHLCYPFSLRHNNIITKLVTYIVMRINEDSRKEVLTIKVDKK